MTSIKETIIIAVGGSLLIPDTIDTGFIKDLKSIIDNLMNQGYQVVLVPGGGKTARNYQQALIELGQSDPVQLDWSGIKAIHLNADLLQRVFGGDTSVPIIYNPEEISGMKNPLVIKAAFKPGSSSDMGAVRMAEILGAKRIVNFSNTSHVYCSDPRVNPNAIKHETLSWDEYRSLIPAEWTPGMSAPFDPVASEKAQTHGVTVAVLGASLQNLENYLNGQEFDGTIIE